MMEGGSFLLACFEVQERKKKKKKKKGEGSCLVYKAPPGR